MVESTLPLYGIKTQLILTEVIFFRSAAHAEDILENGDWQINARKLKNGLIYVESVNYMFFYMDVAVEPSK